MSDIQTAATQRTTASGCASSTAACRINYYLTQAKARSDFKDESLLEFFENHKKDKNLFLRFTETAKIGVFPGTTKVFSTPVGLSSYCMADIIPTYGYSSNPKIITTLEHYLKLPYASDKPFVSFYSYKSNLRLIDTESYSRVDLANDLLNLIKLINTKVPYFFTTMVERTLSLAEDLLDSAEHKAAITLTKYGLKFFNKLNPYETIILAHSFKEARDSTNHRKMLELPFGILWAITRGIAILLTENNFITGSPQATWSNLFRSVGIGGCRDTGHGIIHYNEPAQTIIFSGAYVTPIKIFKNEIKTKLDSSLWKSDIGKALNFWSEGALQLPDPVTTPLTFDETLSSRGKFPPLFTTNERVEFNRYKGPLPKAIKSPTTVVFMTLTEQSSLPDLSQCEGSTVIANCPNIKVSPKLPITVAGLRLRNTPISELPSNVKKVEYLYLRNTEFTHLPTDLEIDEFVLEPKYDIRDFNLPEHLHSKTEVYGSSGELVPYLEYMAKFNDFAPQYKKWDKLTFRVNPKVGDHNDFNTNQDYTGTVTGFKFFRVHFLYCVKCLDSNAATDDIIYVADASALASNPSYPYTLKVS